MAHETDKGIPLNVSYEEQAFRVEYAETAGSIAVATAEAELIKIRAQDSNR